MIILVTLPIIVSLLLLPPWSSQLRERFCVVAVFAKRDATCQEIIFDVVAWNLYATMDARRRLEGAMAL